MYINPGDKDRAIKDIEFCSHTRNAIMLGRKSESEDKAQSNKR